MRPLASIITVTHNSFRSLQRLRECLLGFTAQPYEWIIVDNGSTRPETLIELADIEATRDGTVLYESQNHWFTKGCNLGISRATGDLIVLLNPDCAPQRNWIELMWATAKPRLRNVGIVGAVLVNEQGKIVHGGARGRGDHDGYGLPYHPAHPVTQEREHDGWITGACLLVTRKALEASGGRLDEGYRHYHSDRALCRAVRAAGFSIWMSPAVVLHTVGGSGL